jgi:nicotinamidase-related amidase
MKNTALLLVDIQDSFKTGERWSRRGNPAFEENVTRLLEVWREAGLPRYFILHNDSDPGFRPSDPECRLMSFMNRREDEPLLVKSTRNSFTSTDLQERLAAAGVKRVVITGIQMEQCCETTARVAADLGFDVDFVIDATQTFPIRNRVSGEEISTAALVERTDYVLRDRFARIISARDLATEVREAHQLTT